MDGAPDAERRRRRPREELRKGGACIVRQPTGTTEQRQPERALPDLERLIPPRDRSALAPRCQHFGAGVRVLVEQVGHLRRQLRAPAVERVAVGVVRAEVRADRRQIRRRQALAIVEQRQQLALDDVAIDDAQPGRARLRDLAQEPAQESGLDVGGDAAPARQALTDMVGDGPTRDEDRHRVVQGRLCGRDVVRQRIEQRLGAVRVGQVDHAARKHVD